MDRPILGGPILSIILFTDYKGRRIVWQGQPQF